jgi:hypothetical protein
VNTVTIDVPAPLPAPTKTKAARFLKRHHLTVVSRHRPKTTG